MDTGAPVIGGVSDDYGIPQTTQVETVVVVVVARITGYDIVLRDRNRNPDIRIITALVSRYDMIPVDIRRADNINTVSVVIAGIISYRVVRRCRIYENTVIAF